MTGRSGPRTANRAFSRFCDVMVTVDGDSEAPKRDQDIAAHCLHHDVSVGGYKNDLRGRLAARDALTRKCEDVEAKR